VREARHLLERLLERLPECRERRSQTLDNLLRYTALMGHQRQQHVFYVPLAMALLPHNLL